MVSLTRRHSPPATLSASHANHPFVDGNKRTAAVVSEAFLNMNGFELNVGNEEIVSIFTALAAGQMNEAELADWYRINIL